MNIAVVGATGVVGKVMLEELYNYDLVKNNNITLFASKRSSGNEIIFKKDKYIVNELHEEIDFKKYDIALFSAGGETSRKFAPLFSENKCYVIDNSSAFRMTEGVPLVIPEVNFEEITDDSYIIANPNCSTIQSVVAFYKLVNKFEIKNIDYATYQSVSGSGINGINDLINDEQNFYNRKINQNIIMQIDVFDEDGNTFEETKMIKETNKILNKNYDITATCVRVPVLYGHGVSIKIDFDNEVDLNMLKELLISDDSVQYIYEHDNFKTPLETVDSSKIYVSRIRLSNNKKSLLMFSVTNNIKKGAASNAVQIASKLIERGVNNA